MRYLGGHLGVAVSALLDGQLDQGSAERAWAHVHGCRTCRAQVEREGWVKTQLATMAGNDGPPPQLLGSLYGLGSTHGDRPAGRDGGADAWTAVEAIERRGRGRRRAGLAVAGAGSVSVAVLGLASLTGANLAIGGAPSGTPTSGPTRSPAAATPAVVAPLARVHGRLPSATQPHMTASRSPARSEGKGTEGLSR